MTYRWLFLAAGGLAGTFARYLVAVWIGTIGGVGFPYGTLAINLSACFLVGLFDGLGQARAMLGPEARLLLMTGFCGAYSTFSTWMLESSSLLSDGEPLRAAVNVIGSVIVGFLLLKLGTLLGSTI